MKRKSAALIIVVLILTVSCASQPVDLGIYSPENMPEEDLVTLYVDGWCKIEQIDNYEVDSPSNHDNYFLKLNPGVHTFFTKFENGNAHTMFYMPVTARFEKGNMYYFDYDIKTEKTGSRVTFHIFLYNNNKKGPEVNGRLLENIADILTSYSDNVESPVSQGKSVKLENKNYILVYKPDGTYTQTDKESGITVKGKYIYETPVIIFSGIQKGFFAKVYLFKDDVEFMKKSSINYGVAHTILILVNSTEKEIIYRYEKPLQLKGTELIFNITEVK